MAKKEKGTVKRLIRLPKEVDKQLIKKADNNCLSINSQLVKLLRVQLEVYEQ